VNTTPKDYMDIVTNCQCFPIPSLQFLLVYMCRRILDLSSSNIVSRSIMSRSIIIQVAHLLIKSNFQSSPTSEEIERGEISNNSPQRPR
jgi:hypothetical protein